MLPLFAAQMLAHKTASGAPYPCTSIHLSMYPTSILEHLCFCYLPLPLLVFGETTGWREDTVLFSLEQRLIHKRTFGEKLVPLWETRDHASSFLPCVPTVGQLNS